MGITKQLHLAIPLIASIGLFAPEHAQGIQLRDGTVYFLQPPQLEEVRTTDRSSGVPANYYFTLSLPESAGEPLRQVTLTQQEGREHIRFNLERTRANGKTASASEEKLSLAADSDRQTKSVTLVFDPPVPPGRTVTIRLRSVSNPLFGGVYLFGVTAYPVGEKTHGQFLGYGRLQFSLPGGRP